MRVGDCVESCALDCAEECAEYYLVACMLGAVSRTVMELCVVDFLLRTVVETIY